MEENINSLSIPFFFAGYCFIETLYFFTFRAMPFWGNRKNHPSLRIVRSLPGNDKVKIPRFLQSSMLFIDRVMLLFSIIGTFFVGWLLYKQKPMAEPAFTWYILGIFLFLVLWLCMYRHTKTK